MELALTAPSEDRLPQDIIVKPHYYAVKEWVMARAREIAHLKFRYHNIQTFCRNFTSYCPEAQSIKTPITTSYSPELYLPQQKTLLCHVPGR